MYEQVKNDPEIIDIYKKITDFEKENNHWGHHNYNHVINVANIIEKVLTQLDYSKDIIEEAKVAAILHDAGVIKGKDGHAQRSFEFAKDYIERKNISLKYKEEVLEAIKTHSVGFDTDNIIALVLILADKLDITKKRVTEAGHQVVGMRQMGYINNIDIKIDDDKLLVRFEADPNIDINELLEYYFMKKVLKSTRAFANKINRKSIVYLNEEKLDENF